MSLLCRGVLPEPDGNQAKICCRLPGRTLLPSPWRAQSASGPQSQSSIFTVRRKEQLVLDQEVRQVEGPKRSPHTKVAVKDHTTNHPIFGGHDIAVEELEASVYHDGVPQSTGTQATECS
jgi:hypothetical protein